MKILGVDWGRVRTGVAVSDESGLLARPLKTLEGLSLEGLAEGIARAAAEEGAGSAVLGLPRHMDGREGENAPLVRRLGDFLIARGIAVVYWDERLSTWQADELMKESGTPGRKKKARRDRLAAAVILQGYLDSLKRGPS